MARPTKLKGSQFPYARKVVPEDVRGIIGRTEWKVPLRGDAAAVRIRHAELLQGWEAQIAAARAQLRGEVRGLSQREVQAICGRWYREQLAQHEDDPGKAEDWAEHLDQLRDLIPSVEGRDGEEMSGPFVPPAIWLQEAGALLREQAIAADAASVRAVAEALWQTKVDLCCTMMRWAQGDYSRDRTLERFPEEAPKAKPEAAPGAASSPTAKPFPAAEALALWAAERTPAPNTAKKYRVAFGTVARVLGFDDLRRITPDDVVRFKQERLGAERRNPQTVQDEILACGAVCNWAVENRLLPANPFARLAPKPKRRGPKTRHPYSGDEAVRILQAARAETGWRRWLPWLLAFSGARISEVAEMQRKHVRLERGVPILDFVPLHQRGGKNETFQRMVPIHPAVLAEGFMAYVGGLPADPEGPLFPDLGVAKDGTRTTTATTQHGRWVKGTVGITEAGKAPAHSWRHRMEDELRKVRALPEVQDAITGRHNPRNAGDGYGRGFRGMPDEVLKELSRIPSPITQAQP